MEEIDMYDTNTIRIFLEACGKDLSEVLTTCTEAELLELNAYSYAIYAAVFGEVKMRIAEQALIQELNEASRNVWGYSHKMKVEVN